MGISIVMPAYNAGAYLAAAIASVLAQSYTNWELIIVDDGSTDNTASIAVRQTDLRIRHLKTGGQLGAAAARNLGTAAARYEWLNYLDADDILRPDALAQLWAAKDQHPEAGLIYADYERMTEQGKLTGSRRWLRPRLRPSGDVLRKLLYRNFIVNGGVVLVRKPLVEQVGGWNPALRISNDWALWTLLASQTPFYYLKGYAALQYRDVATGLTRSLNTSYERMRPAIDFVFTHPLVTAKVTATDLARLRRIKDAHIHVFLAAQQARQRGWKSAFGNLLRSLWLDLRHAPQAMAEFTLAAVDGLLVRSR